MPPSKIRFVTACQQLLALGVVLAALTPAASVVSLDVVHETPVDGASGPTIEGDLSAYTRASARPSKVPTEVVDPTVTEYSLTAAPGARGRTQLDVLPAAAGRGKVGALPAADVVTSIPQAVVGYGAVGVTWQHGVTVPEDGIEVQVRTRPGDAWSD